MYGRGRGRGRGEGSPPPEQVINPAAVIAAGPPPIQGGRGGGRGRGVMMNLPPLPVQGVGINLGGFVPQQPFPVILPFPGQQPIPEAELPVPAMVALGFQFPPQIQPLFPPLPPALNPNPPQNFLPPPPPPPPPAPGTPPRRSSAGRI